MNRIILAVITVATLITFSLPVHAEKYQGIGPFDTLGYSVSESGTCFFMKC
jgi:hypothetical protein